MDTSSPCLMGTQSLCCKDPSLHLLHLTANLPLPSLWQSITIRERYALLVDDDLNRVHQLYKQRKISTAQLDLFYETYLQGVKPDSYYEDVADLDLPHLLTLDLEPKRSAPIYLMKHVWNDEICFDEQDSEILRDMRLLVFLAPPYSGKTTLARTQPFKGWNVVDVDDLIDWPSIIGKFEFNSKGWTEAVLTSIKHSWSKYSHSHPTMLMLHAANQAAALNLPITAQLLVDRTWLLSQRCSQNSNRIDVTLANYDSYIAAAKEYGTPLIQYGHPADLIPLLTTLTLNACGAETITPPDAEKFKTRRQKEDKINAAYAQEMLRRRGKPDFEQLSALSVSNSLNTAFGSQPTLISWLKLHYPYSIRSLAMRARTSHALLARLIRLYHNVDTADFHYIILSRSVGLGLQGLTNILSIGWWRPRMQGVLMRFARAGHFEKGGEHTQKYFKDLHNISRRVGKALSILDPAGDLTCNDLMYLDQIPGRFVSYQLANDDTVQVREEEITHVAYDEQQRLTEAEFVKLTDEVLLELSQAYGRGARDKLQEKMTPEAFSAYYISVGASGSASSGRHELEHAQFDKVPTKRFWLGELDVPQLLSIFMREPTVMTTCVIKTELAKLRQLLPGPVWHWLAESLVLFLGERTVMKETYHVMMEKSATETLARMRNREIEVQMACRNLCIVCDLDYKDFNITHSYQSMRSLYQKFAEQLRAIEEEDKSWMGYGICAFAAQTCDWLDECFDNMYARSEGGDGVFHKLRRGLWTGWRSTAFINIMFNYVYARVVNKQSLNLFSHVLLNSFDSMGDDVHATCSTKMDAIWATQLFMDNRHELQDLKQLIGCRAEFLRCWYDGTGIHGNLNRSICSFWSSDMQSAAIVNGPEFIRGTSSALSGLIRRGANLHSVEQCRNVILGHFSTIRGRRNGGYYLKNHEWLYVQEKDGGMGCNRYGMIPRSAQKARIEMPSIDVTFAVLGAKREGLNNIKQLTAQRLHANGVHFSKFPDMERAAIDSAEETMLPAEVSRLKVALMMTRETLRLEYYNSHYPVYLDDAPFDKSLIDVADQVLTNFEVATPNDLRRWRSQDVEKAVAAVEAICLKQASVYPLMLKQLDDIHTGERLSMHEAILRLGGMQAAAVLGPVFDIFPAEYVVEMLSKDARTFRNHGDVIPAELNVILTEYHYRVLASGQGRYRTTDEREWHMVNSIFIRQYLEREFNKKYAI